MTIKKGSITIASSTPTTEWGSIEGTLADQFDLQSVLNTKAPTLSPALTGIPTTPLASEGNDSNQIASTKFVNRAINNAIENIDALPDQTGKNGKFLTTNGTDASWGDIPSELPSQSGQAGKVLTTNGSVVSWTEYQSAPATDDETIHLNSSDELEVIGTIEKNAGDVKYDWVGTYEEWEEGRANETIPDDWICYIVDDYVPSTVTHNIGDIFYSLRTENIMNGAVVCNGTEYDIADYSTGNISLKSLLDSGKIPYISIADFDAAVLANGSCRCFGYDGGLTFKVPKLNDVFIEAGVAANNSEFIEAGLPNITGSIAGSIKGDYNKIEGSFTDAYLYGSGSLQYGGGSYGTYNAFGFDASQSNPIYGNSTTVQPNSIKYRAYVQLANATSESALQTVSSVVNDVTTLQEEMEETLKYKNITNCITKIPQDIKLELNNGTLTVKSGTRFYLPNGNQYQTITDATVSAGSANAPYFIFGTVSSGTSISLARAQVSICYSGSTQPSFVGAGIWFDTTNNIIKYSSDGGATWSASDWSFPLAICTPQSDAWVSIDQVFNGFGYIGSTGFALPGVKGLLPNGINEDGSLKNIEFTTSKVITDTSTLTNTVFAIYSGDFTRYTYFVESKIKPNTTYTLWYNTEENKMYESGSTTDFVLVNKIPITPVIRNSSGKITSFNPKTVFHALEWNDKRTIAGWGMPSTKYIDLSLGASGNEYTAPANGYVFVEWSDVTSSAGGSSLDIQNPSIRTYTSDLSWQRHCLPIQKGQKYRVYYASTSGRTLSMFKFYYAEGEL